MELLLGFIIGITILGMTPLRGLFMKVITPAFIIELFKRHKQDDVENISNDLNEEIKNQCEPVYKRDGDTYYDSEYMDYKEYDERAYIINKERINNDTYEMLAKEMHEWYQLPTGAFKSPEVRADRYHDIMERIGRLIKRDKIQEQKDEGTYEKKYTPIL